MLNRENRKILNQVVLISFLASWLIPLFAIFIEFIINIDLPSNLEGIGLLYKTNGIHWVILSMVVIIPVVTFFISWFFLRKLDKVQKNLNQYEVQTRNVNSFTEGLIHDDFSVEYVHQEDDELGKILIDLRDTLKKNKEEEEKRRKEDEIRNWISEGLAKFGAILRNDNDNLEALSFNVIRELTNYIGAIQGGFYMLKDDDKDNPNFELTAFFAYGRKKFADKQLKWGDGLIGTCGVERKTIYMTKVPQNYVNVTSGLGESNPRSILIVPLLSEGELYGIIEFASLKQMEDHEIRLTEEVAESIATTLSTVRINIRTNKLLEESKAQAQALSSQEEEMRQNMEELQATQEEAARQSENFISLDNAINDSFIKAEYGLDGKLISANNRFIEKFEFKNQNSITNMPISKFIHEQDEEWFMPVWESIAKKGKTYQGFMPHKKNKGKSLWVQATYCPMKNKEGQIDKILFVALDAADRKMTDLYLDAIEKALSSSGTRLEMDINGNVTEFNDPFIEMCGYSENQLKKLTIFDLLDDIEVELFNRSWENIIKGSQFNGIFKIKPKNMSDRWIKGSFNAVADLAGEISKVVFAGYDYTETKILEAKTNAMQEQIDENRKQIKDTEKEYGQMLRETRNDLMSKYKEIERSKIMNEQTLDNLTDAVITTTHDNKIIVFNKAAEIFFGYTKDQALKQDIGLLFSDTAIESNEFISKYTGPGNNKIINKRTKVYIKNKNGEEIPVYILLSKAEVDNLNTYTAFIHRIK